MKKMIKLLMSATMLLGLAACGGADEQQGSDSTAAGNSTAEEASFDYADVKIGVLGHMQSGETLDALTVYMDALSEEVGFSYEYVVGSSYDEQTNITAVQNLIASGVDGIILAIDSGTPAILQECEAAGVFLSAFITDMDSSFDELKSSDYYLGNVNDGLYDTSSIGEKAAELVIKDGNTNVGIVTFPLLYFPQKSAAIQAFTKTIESHNDTATEPIEIYETQELSFSALEDTYFNNYPELDSIFSLASGFVHPTMVSADKTDIDLYTTGFKKDDLDAFENGEMRMMTLSNVEVVALPVAMILNAVAEKPFADQPEEAERIDTSVVFVTNDEELTALEEKCFYFTADIDQAFISPEDFTQYLTAYNPDASYEEFKEVLVNMSMEDLMAK